MSRHFLLSAAAKTLSQSAVARMSDNEARTTFQRIRWADNAGEPYCPRCGCLKVKALATRPVWKCSGCGHQFSVTAGTIFADHKRPILDYLLAIAIFANGVKGYSALQLSRDLTCQYKTAFVLAHKLREAIEAEQAKVQLDGQGDKEVDGAYFGGSIKPKNIAEDRVDRRTAEEQTGKRQVVVVRATQKPEVNVAQAQPQVQVNQPPPQVQVTQPPQQPQVQVQAGRPQVDVQQAGAAPNVQVQENNTQPTVHYESAQPKVVITQPQGGPQVRFEQADTNQQGRPEQNAASDANRQQLAAANRQPSPTTGTAVPGPAAATAGQPLPVSRIKNMVVYDAKGTKVGDVERIVQAQNGKEELIVGVGGFLGLGERHVAISTENVAVRGDRLLLEGLTEDQLKRMPTVDRNSRDLRDVDGNATIELSSR